MHCPKLSNALIPQIMDMKSEHDKKEQEPNTTMTQQDRDKWFASLAIGSILEMEPCTDTWCKKNCRQSPKSKSQKWHKFTVTRNDPTRRNFSARHEACGKSYDIKYEYDKVRPLPPEKQESSEYGYFLYNHFFGGSNATEQPIAMEPKPFRLERGNIFQELMYILYECHINQCHTFSPDIFHAFLGKEDQK